MKTSLKLNKKIHEVASSSTLQNGARYSKLENVKYNKEFNNGQDENDDDNAYCEATLEGTEIKARISYGWYQHCKTFSIMTLPYFQESRSAKCNFASLVVLMLLHQAESIINSYLQRDFWTALGNKDVEMFYINVRNWLLLILILAPVSALFKYQERRLNILWREWMTQKLFDQYANLKENMSCGGLNLNMSRIDNPDQRLAEDVQNFTEHALSLFLGIFKSIMDTFSFACILYSIRPLLDGDAILFCILGTSLTMVVGRKLSDLNFERLRREADFRYGLALFRQDAENCTKTHSTKDSKVDINNSFQSVLENSRYLISTQRNLELVKYIYNHLSWALIPSLVLAPDYFDGFIELGTLQQACNSFHHVLSGISFIIHEFERLSEFAASKERLHQFMVTLEDGEEAYENDEEEGSDTTSAPFASSPLNQPPGNAKDEEDVEDGHWNHPAIHVETPNRFASQAA